MTTPDLTHKRERFYDAVFAATNLEHKHLSIERELMALKWYGYRFLTPLAATRLFYDTYREHLTHFLREHKDKDLADAVPNIEFDHFVKKLSNLTAAWTARQCADVFGVPYNLYIEFCMWFWSRRSWGGRRYAPQINQLSYSEKSEEAWRLEFGKFVEDRLGHEARLLANVPQLHPAEYRETSEQVAARAFLLNLASKSKSSWADQIEKWCFSVPLLTTDTFKSIIPAEVFEAAMESINLEDRDPPIEPSPLSPGALWPTCHGMPGARAMTQPACVSCKFADSCGQLATMVEKEVRRTSGHSQPRKVQLRASANARQREYRARQKLAAAHERAGYHVDERTEAPMPEVLISWDLPG